MFFLRVLTLLLCCLLFENPLMAQGEYFHLLSDREGGIVFQKDICQKNVFHLTFTFSNDIEDLGYDELQFVQFSQSFKEILRSSNEGLLSVDLQVQSSRLIGNRQIQVDYLVSKISENGGGTELNLPSQIEVQLMNNDLSKILDQNSNRLVLLSESESIKTLIDANTKQECLY